MREILFKAKRKDNGEWVYWNIIGELRRESGKRTRLAIKNGATTSYYHYIHQIWQFILIDTICQYTGLTDKNGNKIWENDVVEFLGHKGNIVFECGCFGIGSKITIDWDKISDNIFPITGCNNFLKACENDNFISLWEIYWNFNEEENCIYMIETIGNIFDNPELLGV